jgi:ribosomal protein S18 acetylase RimI-like enzyme
LWKSAGCSGRACDDQGVRVRALTHDDGAWKDASVRGHWGSTVVARHGELVDAAGLPGFVALVDDTPVGLVTVARRGDDLEVVTIHVEHEGRGVGRALMDVVRDHARRTGVRRIWLITTNDNVRALRFYQRWGMDLVALVRDGVAASRAVKPSIPACGRDGIPIRHELELELRLELRLDAGEGAP